MEQNSFEKEDGVLQQFNVTIIPKKEIVNEYESISPAQVLVGEGNPVLNIDCWKQAQVLAFQQEFGDEKVLDKIIGSLHPTRIGEALITDTKESSTSSLSNQGGIKQGMSPQVEDSPGTSIKPEMVCPPSLLVCQTEETQRGEISFVKESPNFLTAETADIHGDGSSSAKVSSSTQTESSPKPRKTVVVINAESDEVNSSVFITEIKEPSPSLDIRNYSCIECSRPMKAQSHFRSYRKCSLCCYATNCCTAFTKHKEFHSAHYHKNRISTLRERKIKDNRIIKLKQRKMKDPLLCVCGFVSRYGDKAARHLLRCTEEFSYQTVRNVDVCDKHESEEDKPGTILSGEVGQNGAQEAVKMKKLGLKKTGETQTTAESSMTPRIRSSVKKIREETELRLYSIWTRKGNKRRRRGKWRLDEITEISADNIKRQLMDTSDIVGTLDFAPPTKRMMQLKRREGVERLFVQPGRRNTIAAVSKLFQQNLITLKEEDEEEAIKLENNNESPKSSIWTSN